MPWYLQDSTQRVPPSPILERQRLPPLPDNPPSNLESILNHLSVDIGLDYLHILDLRALEPPPALGGNLIMLVGTARSEKHLHVAADRFCRWLRSTYRLSPHADGLLGRNELKIKIRRRVRRAKERARRGLGEETAWDDGISTGWICVNVGQAEGPPAEVLRQATEQEGITGFGSESAGTTLVVQMLTEEKREELDLEGLWEGELARQERREKERTENLLVEAQGSALAETGLSQKVASRSPAIDSLTPRLGPFEQKRAFHAAARKLFPAQATDLTATPPLSSSPPGSAPVRTMASHSGPSRAALADIQPLEDLLSELRRLPPSKALEALGTGSRDTASTPFLQRWAGVQPLFPGLRHWIMRFRFTVLAIDLGHRGYHEQDLLSILELMQTANVAVPIELVEHMLAALADTPGFQDVEPGKGAQAYKDCFLT